MQLRSVDPRILIDNPNNPRRTAVHAVHDQQLVASIRDSNGPLQPPTVREQADGSLVIVYGHRRKYASIAAGLAWLLRCTSQHEAAICDVRQRQVGGLDGGQSGIGKTRSAGGRNPGCKWEAGMLARVDEGHTGHTTTDAVAAESSGM